MSVRARGWCLGYAAVLAAITTIPYLTGFATAGDAWGFSGFVFGVEDGNSYIAKMRQGAEGAWLFRTPYTTQAQRGVIAFLPYLLLGKLTSPPAMHEQLVALFHLARVLAIPMEVLATYQLATAFLAEERWRRWSVVMATAGGGLGWVLFVLGQPNWLGSPPLDLHSPESFGFLAIYGLPHLVLGRALLLFGLKRYLDAFDKPQAAWAGGMLWFALGLVQPLQAAVGVAVMAGHGAALGLWAVLRREAASLRRWVRTAGRVCLLSLAPLVYTAAAFVFDPYLRAWSEQNRIFSPHPLHYVAAYGVVALPAVVGVERLIRRTPGPGLLLAAWVAMLPVLAYAPVNVQRRLPEGVWVALSLLAAAALEGGGRKAGGRVRWGVMILGASLPSTLLLLAGGMWTAMRPASPAFLPTWQVRALAWLETVAEPGDVVLASYPTSNALPAWAPVRVIIGHGPESASLEELQPQVEAFFNRTTHDGQRLAILRGHDVAYVFHGPDERSLGAWNPDAAPYLEQAADFGEYSVYRVKSGGD